MAYYSFAFWTTTKSVFSSRVLISRGLLGWKNRCVVARKRNTTEGSGTQRVETPNTTKTSPKLEFWTVETAQTKTGKTSS